MNCGWNQELYWTETTEGNEIERRAEVSELDECFDGTPSGGSKIKEKHQLSNKCER